MVFVEPDVAQQHGAQLKRPLYNRQLIAEPGKLEFYQAASWEESGKSDLDAGLIGARERWVATIVGRVDSWVSGTYSCALR